MSTKPIEDLAEDLPGGPVSGSVASRRLIAIVGNPNVGKSVLFGALTGKYATVSNYPGTTVEVTRAHIVMGAIDCEIVDTPGMYSLNPITEEERVARLILIDTKPSAVLHVVDAKNLDRMLPLTFQLLEAGLPTILTLNMIDEAESEGVFIDLGSLARELGIPVIATAASTGRGIPDLKAAILKMLTDAIVNPSNLIRYSARTEQAVEAVLSTGTSALQRIGLSPRSIALFILRDDPDIKGVVESASPEHLVRLARIVGDLKSDIGQPLEYEMAVTLKNKAQAIAAGTMRREERPQTFRERLSRAMMQPLTGLPILGLVLYLGLYKFVGGFGAGTVVEFIEQRIFREHVNPLLTELITNIVPWRPLQDLFVGDYGMLTLGIRYAVALIMPIVTLFFLVFAVIEDTGYLPRLAMLVDRTFKKIGLSGRAVIPMVLGLGCDTMATMVTRTLPTKRERIISTLLLALAVPCSAQLGVILALLEGHPAAVLVWAAVVCGVFLAVGYLAAKVLPGHQALFYMEVPPLRWPKLSNVLIKTYTRMVWYFKEVLPLFLVASVLIWLGNILNLFNILVAWLRLPIRWIGLPDAAAPMFLFGFFRRDYGAAGLYDLHKAGALAGRQLVVACVALTLFLPCIAQFLMNVKERGWKTGVAISIFVLFFSFGVAYLVNLLLVGLGIPL